MARNAAAREQIPEPRISNANGLWGLSKVGVITMLGWALGFLVLALIAALFGFGGIASASAGIAQILFVVFLILFAVSLIVRLARGR